MGGFAWVTLATNDSYSLGALVLANSLKQVGTKHQLAVLVTPGITSAMRDKLATVFDVVQEVNILDSRDETNLRLLKRPELGITFTKLHCWRLTQFEKCVFLDADTLVLQNSDELFEREELSAAPDVGWPDCFNSGVFVYRPSLETYDRLIQFALERGSFDGGDQGLLNLFFSDWAHKDINKHLPFIYNVCSTACYSYLPAFKQFGANAKIIHFIGSVKPWLQYFNTETKKVHPSGDATHVTEFLQRWWDIFCAFIHPQLSPAMQDQSQHRSNPVYVPPQYDPPVPTTENFENNWDPWDEYDLKVSQNPSVPVSFNIPDSQPVEFHQEPEVTIVPKESSYAPQPETVYRVLTPPSEIHKEPEVPQIIEYVQHEHHTPKDSGEPFHPQNDNNSNIEHQPDVLYFDRPSDIKDDFINNDQTPQPPNQSNLRPETPSLPYECETTATLTSDISLKNTTAEDVVSQENAGLAGAFSQLTLGVARTAEQDALENVLRKQAWEVGSIDYLGKDSFENIWSKISQTLSAASAPQESQTPAPPAEPVPSSPTPAPVEAPVPVPVAEPTPAPVTPPVAAPTPAPATPPVAVPTPAPATPPVAAPTPAPATLPAVVPTPAPATPPVVAPTPTPATLPAAVPTPTPATPPVAVPTSAPATPPVAAPSPAPVAAPTTPPVAAPASAPVAEAAAAAPAPAPAKKAQKGSKSPATKPGPAPPSAE